jgi:alkylation response protein AidB-like acyl-CoA dehydrogenase
VGADLVAAAARALAHVLTHAQERRLPRHQIVLFALADLATRVEIAAVLAAKAARPGEAPGEARSRLAATSRVFARQAVEETVRLGRSTATGFEAPGDPGGAQAARALLDVLARLAEYPSLAGQWTDMVDLAARL